MDKIAVLDFGGQYAHLIANRIRKIGVYSEILDGATPADKLKEYKGLILSGGPASVSAPDSVKCDPKIFELGMPILGICYGHQLIAYNLGGTVEKGKVREYGAAVVNFKDKPGIFAEVKDQENVWMSHFDQVTKLPEGFELIAYTNDCPIAGMINLSKKIWSIQFHPEVVHTPCGMGILTKFVDLTGAKKEWDIDNYIDQILEEIKVKVGDRKVFLMISGGVDSTVAFLLLDKALGPERVYGLFVDTGFLRLNEREEVEAALRAIGVTNLHVYDAKEEYFEALKGVYEPEKKRQIIGDLFLDIQAKVSNDLNLNPEEWMLGQGTIYPDTIETGGTKHADKIKTHHNQVDRIKKMAEAGKVIEPLNQLYKDEVRIVGAKLGLADKMVWRHPFPGPGLAVRTLCAPAEDYPEGYKEAEARITEVVQAEGWEAKILPIKSVGVQGDERTYKHPVLLYRESFSWDGLSTLGTRLTNQFNEVNRVLVGLYPQEIKEFYVPDSQLTGDRILTIQRADKVVMDFIYEAKIDKEVWQFPTVLIPLSVNEPGTESIVLRPVCSEEAMTANFYQMREEHLKELTERLKKVPGISGVFYDITNKPPGTIEWE
ncbi:MAG: glutamine-hydrolyzing GMP synthase [Patescibacteria group bacterium]